MITKPSFTFHLKSVLFAPVTDPMAIAWLVSIESTFATLYFFTCSINHCASFLTLCYRWGGVGAVRELVGGNAGHGWRWETPWDQVIKCHQLIGSCLLPPSCPPVAEPNLEGQWWQHLINVCYVFQIIHKCFYWISRHSIVYAAAIDKNYCKLSHLYFCIYLHTLHTKY